MSCSSSSCAGTCFDISVHVLRVDYEAMKEERDQWFNKYDSLRTGIDVSAPVNDPVAGITTGSLTIPPSYEYSIRVIDSNDSATGLPSADDQVSNASGSIIVPEAGGLIRTRRTDGQPHNELILTIPTGVEVYYEYDPA